MQNIYITASAPVLPNIEGLENLQIWLENNTSPLKIPHNNKHITLGTKYTIKALDLLSNQILSYEDTGLLIGTSSYDLFRFEKFHNEYIEKGTVSDDGGALLWGLPLSHSAYGGIHLKLKGAIHTYISAGETGGLTALVEACSLLQYGPERIVLAGGVENPRPEDLRCAYESNYESPFIPAASIALLRIDKPAKEEAEIKSIICAYAMQYGIQSDYNCLQYLLKQANISKKNIKLIFSNIPINLNELENVKRYTLGEFIPYSLGATASSLMLDIAILKLLSQIENREDYLMLIAKERNYTVGLLLRQP